MHPLVAMTGIPSPPVSQIFMRPLSILALLILPLIGSWATVVTLESYHRFVSGPVPQLAYCTSP